MIDRFTGDYHFLSNFYPSRVEYAGNTYPSAEHAYQAAKAINTNDRAKIRKAETPKEAKRLGCKIKLRRDWESVKLAVMKDVVLSKFIQNRDLRHKLIMTGDEELVEGNDWGDTYWGRVDNKGQNKLGTILMQVREQLARG